MYLAEVWLQGYQALSRRGRGIGEIKGKGSKQGEGGGGGWPCAARSLSALLMNVRSLSRVFVPKLSVANLHIFPQSFRRAGLNN